MASELNTMLTTPRTPSRPIDIVMVAGEASGDFLAAHLIHALKQRFPQIRIAGIAGPLMAQAGCETWIPQEKLAVRGYIEVIKHLPELLRIRKNVTERTLQEHPSVFIGIDAPDFNLSIEKTLKSQGIPTIHYVSPSLWAWRPERIEKIRAAVHHCLLLFPFESELYAHADIPHTIVGHPISASFRPFSTPTFPQNGETIKLAILPGSRESELSLHSRLFADTLKQLHQKGYPLEVYLPLISHQHRAYLEPLFAAIPSVHVSVGNSREILQNAHLGIIASGTASLEAALADCPHIITYKLNPLTAWLVKRKLRLPYVGLPNVLVKDFVVPEFLQDNATAENLSQAIENLILDKWSRSRQHQAFERIFSMLDRPHEDILVNAITPFLSL